MFNKKAAIAGLMAIVLSTAAQVPQAQAAGTVKNVQFTINKASYTNESGEHSLAVAPYVLHGHSMVPLRALAQSLGAAISWNQAAATVTLTGQPFGQLKMKVNTAAALNVKGEQIILPERIKLVKGNLMVPVKSVADILGAKTAWNSSADTVTVSPKSDSGHNLAVSYDFSAGNQGWKAGFADLPVNYNKEIYALQYTWELLPLAGNTSNYGLKLKGANRSDDLFMFLTQKIAQLAPNTAYQVKLNFGMYTDEAGGMSGIGGAPAEAVHVKAAVLGKEPKAVQKDDGSGLYYRMNIDKGNQSEEGADAKIVGNIAKPESDKEGYQRVDFSYNARVTSNANGELFLLIGTDSGYEGLTTLYFDDIRLSAATIN